MNKEEKYAYEMGKDCSKNGANTTNCHFTIFSTHKKMKAWEEGQRDGDKERTDLHEDGRS